jgi:hypothetical protein
MGMEKIAKDCSKICVYRRDTTIAETASHMRSGAALEYNKYEAER